MSRGLRAGFAVGWGIVSIFNWVQYTSKPELNNIDLLKNEAEYVQIYNGPNPADALDHALASIDAVKVTNPDNTQEIMALEKDINQYKSEVSVLLSGQVDYQDQAKISEKLATASTRLETFADENSKDDSDLFGAVIWGVGSLCWGIGAILGEDD